MARKPGAGLLIVRPEDGRVLLVRRSRAVTKPGFWGVPGGGVESGETEEETALREGEEELGGLPRIRMPRTEQYWHATDPFFSFVIFHAEMLPGQRRWRPELNPENDRWGWFPPDALPSPLMPGTREAVLDLLGPR